MILFRLAFYNTDLIFQPIEKLNFMKITTDVSMFKIDPKVVIYENDIPIATYARCRKKFIDIFNTKSIHISELFYLAVQ